jgi:inosose dehydratase
LACSSSRREFLERLTALAAMALLPVPLSAKPDLLYPPMDLSYFDTPISPVGADIHIGYAAITWDGNDRQAIEDIASLGFRGIQLRSNVLTEFPGGAAEVRELLQKHNLTMVALSSGGVHVDGPDDAAEIDKHVRHARFVHDVGGHYLQVTDDKPKRPVTAADYKHLGALMREIGKRSADLGVPLGYHNHMGSMGERPEEVDRVLDAADPRYVKLELDIAHYYQGGGDPAKAIERYKDRLLFLHIKDVAARAPSQTAKNSYVFVELGQGKVDIPAAFAVLKRVGFHGWAVVELDGNPEKEKEPKQAAMVNKKYVEQKLGMQL